MRNKMTKKYQIFHHQIRFFKLKMHQNPFSAGAPPRTRSPGPHWGSLRRSHRPPSRLGRGIPPPHFPACSNSVPMAPQFSSPLNTNSWLRQWVDKPTTSKYSVTQTLRTRLNAFTRSCFFNASAFARGRHRSREPLLADR